MKFVRRHNSIIINPSPTTSFNWGMINDGLFFASRHPLKRKHLLKIAAKMAKIEQHEASLLKISEGESL